MENLKRLAYSVGGTLSERIVPKSVAVERTPEYIFSIIAKEMEAAKITPSTPA